MWYQVCNNPEFQGFLVKLEWRLIQGFLLLLKPKALSLSMGSAGFREGGSCSGILCVGREGRPLREWWSQRFPLKFWPRCSVGAVHGVLALPALP